MFDGILADKYLPLFQAQGLTLFYPHKDCINYSADRSGRLHLIRAPVLGVFGTSSMQGKFTLQLQLRDCFQKNGYQVGQIGTEPSSFLFGMEDTFPFGYASEMRLDGDQFIMELNTSLHRVDIKESDLIITGSQSGTVPLSANHMKYLNTHQLDFLIGLNPDIVVLCVNLFDPMKYIIRSINVIESLMDCKVVALGISALKFKDDWSKVANRKVCASDAEIELFRKMLFEKTGLASFVIGTTEVDGLSDACIDYLSADADTDNGAC